MKIRVNDPALVADLVAYLEAQDCVAQPIGPNTIEASRLSSVRHDQARLELDLYLRAWQAANPDARAEIVD